jgi:Helix-turn-helix domain
VNDNKSEGTVVVESQSERSRAVSADGAAQGESATARESSPRAVTEAASKESAPAATVAKPTEGGGKAAAKAKAAGIDVDGGKPGAKDKTADAEAVEQSLGTFLIAAREGRGLSADDVVRETRLPAHYLRMMETNDYSEISDQLYLVPFLRRYAGFLELDQEDVAMRFVREVQRADGNPGPPRLDQPLVAEPRQRRGWTGAIVVIGLLAAAVGVYVYESNRHPQVNADTMMSHTSAGVAGDANAGPDSSAPPPTQ